MNPYKESKFKKETIVCFGDSQTDVGSAYGVQAHENYAQVLCELLSKNGYQIKPRIWGIGGYTSNEVLGIMDSAFAYDNPKFAVFYAGVNDQGSTANLVVSSTTANTVTFPNTTNGRKYAFLGNVFTSATGETKNIIAYNEKTFTITLDSNFLVQPVVNSNVIISSPTQVQTQKNIQIASQILRFGVKGIEPNTKSDLVVTYVSQLPANCKEGTRLVVSQDKSITGGIGSFATHQRATIKGDFSLNSKISVWECRNKKSGEMGWGRVATSDTGSFDNCVQTVFVVSPNYLNFPAGGDNYNSQTDTGVKYATYQNIRNACKDACLIEKNTKFVDLYDYMSKLIWSDGNAIFEGKLIEKCFTQGEGDWHCIPTNQHHNALGHQIVAYAIYLAFVNTIN